MSLIKILSFGLAISFLSFACKHSDGSLSQASGETSDDGAPTVLILLGGFASCSSDSYSKATPIGSSGPGSMSKIRDTVLPAFAKTPDRILSTCYAIEFSPNMVLSEVDAFHVFLVDSAKPKLVVSLQPDAMMEHIIKTLREPELKNAKVHIVGHSYGGWTAMRLLQQIVKTLPAAAEQPFHIQSFVTLDPISKNECKPKTIIDYVNALQKNAKPLPEDLSPEGCRRAPIEFNSELPKMSCRVAVWKNYYQKVSGILASSEVGLGLNLPIDNIDLMGIPTERNPQAFQKGTVGAHLAFLKEEPLLGQIKALLSEQQKKPFALQSGCQP